MSVQQWVYTSSWSSAPARPMPPTRSPLHELVSQHGRPPSPDNSEHTSPNVCSSELGEDDERHDVLPITVDGGDEIMPVEGWQDRAEDEEASVRAIHAPDEEVRDVRSIKAPPMLT